MSGDTADILHHFVTLLLVITAVGTEKILTRNNKKLDHIEEKLDRIIDMEEDED